MVGADVVTRTRGGERASAMWLPGTASWTLSTQAYTVVIGVALLRCTMDFTYLVAMQLYVSFFGLAVVAAFGPSLFGREPGGHGRLEGSDARLCQQCGQHNLRRMQFTRVPGGSC